MALPPFIRRLLTGERAPPVVAAPWLRQEIDTARRAETSSVLTPALNNRNGFVREAALFRAAETLWPETLPFVITRVNDWVPQVRDAARRSFRAYMDAGKFDDIVAALPEVFALRDCRRENHEAFVAGVEAWLKAQPKAATLPGLIPRSGPKLARSLFDFCQRNLLAETGALVRLGLRSRDVVTKRKAVRQIAQLPEGERQPLIDSLLRSGSGWQRLEGLRLLDEAAAKELSRKYLLDPYTSLREWCERRAGLTPDELMRLRRDTLKDEALPAARLATAIRLCGAAKDGESEALIKPFLSDRRKICRGAALLALSRLAPETYEADIRAALADASGHIGRAAVQAALETNLGVSPEQYAGYAAEARTLPAARRLLSFAATRSKWDHLGLALEFHALGKFAEDITEEFPRWVRQFNRSSVSATPAQMAWIRKNLAGYAGPRPSKKEIEFYLT